MSRSLHNPATKVVAADKVPQANARGNVWMPHKRAPRRARRSRGKHRANGKLSSRKWSGLNRPKPSSIPCPPRVLLGAFRLPLWHRDATPFRVTAGSWRPVGLLDFSTYARTGAFCIPIFSGRNHPLTPNLDFSLFQRNVPSPTRTVPTRRMPTIAPVGSSSSEMRDHQWSKCHPTEMTA
jgi:hypothetical protein